MAKKNINLNQLAERMDKGFTSVHKKIDDLTDITRNSFNEVDRRFNKVDKRFDVVEQRLENIELKLGNVAYRFEIEEVVRRVNILEKKVGLK